MADPYQAQYRGVRGTARLIGRRVQSAIKGGSGMAATAGRGISGRQRSIDDAVDAAVTGRQRNAQTTDSNNP